MHNQLYEPGSSKYMKKQRKPEKMFSNSISTPNLFLLCFDDSLSWPTSSVCGYLKQTSLSYLSFRPTKTVS